MKIVHQVTAVLLTTVTTVVAMVGAWMYVAVEQGFSGYVRTLEEARLQPAVERLGRLWKEEGSWDALARDPRRFGRMLRREEGPEEEGSPPPPAPDERRPPPREDARRPPADDEAPPRPRPDRPPRRPERVDTDPLELPPRASLYDASGRRIVGQGSLEADASRIPLVVDGARVGWLGVRGIPEIDRALDLRYVDHVRRQIALVALAAALIGLLAGTLLARRLLRPVLALRDGTRRLTTGDYEARIAATGADELTQLARDFNALAATLAGDERARRQWVADTSHELRTPITVLRAEVEAMLDGVRPCGPAAVASLHAELQRLSKLVDDLGELARADRGAVAMTRVPVAPVAALRDTVSLFAGRFERRRLGVEIDVAGAEGARVSGDRDRLQQIYANLLENSLRYTDEGGAIRVSAVRGDDELLLRFDDSAPGVPAAELPHLFERFYRVEASRSRAHGGSGLGLTICQRLVEAHGGSIRASASPLGGVRVEISLPLIPERRSLLPASRRASS